MYDFLGYTIVGCGGVNRLRGCALCLEGSDELVYLLFRYVLHYDDVSQVAAEVLVISLGEGIGVDDFI